MSQGRLDFCCESLARQLLLTQWGLTSIASREREQMPVFRRFGATEAGICAYNKSQAIATARKAPDELSQKTSAPSVERNRPTRSGNAGIESPLAPALAGPRSGDCRAAGSVCARRLRRNAVGQLIQRHLLHLPRHGGHRHQLHRLQRHQLLGRDCRAVFGHALRRRCGQRYLVRFRRRCEFRPGNHYHQRPIHPSPLSHRRQRAGDRHSHAHLRYQRRHASKRNRDRHAGIPATAHA